MAGLLSLGLNLSQAAQTTAAPEDWRCSFLSDITSQSVKEHLLASLYRSDTEDKIQFGAHVVLGIVHGDIYRETNIIEKIFPLPLPQTEARCLMSTKSAVWETGEGRRGVAD